MMRLRVLFIEAVMRKLNKKRRGVSQRVRSVRAGEEEPNADTDVGLGAISDPDA
jgi:hypothetical protein